MIYDQTWPQPAFFWPLNRGNQGEPWVKVAGWQGRFMCHLRNEDTSREKKNDRLLQVDC